MTAGLAVFLLVLAFMAMGVPVAFAFLAANLLGAWILVGDWYGPLQVVDNSTSLITSFTLVAVPMFVFMGALLFHSGLALRVFDALETLFGRLPARLSYITVAGGSTFSTLTGSTMANTAMLGSLMIPEMTRRGYAPHMSIGPIIGTGGLAMLIPPSSLGVLLGSLAGLNIGALLIAGILPGLVLAVGYSLVIYLQARLNPASAPSYGVQRVPVKRRVQLVVFNIMPLGLVVFCVVGFIVLGWATPSEAAAFGALSVAALAAFSRRLTVRALRAALASTVRISGMVFLLILSSSVFSQLMAFSGASTAVVEWSIALEAGPYAKLLLMFALMLVLGMFMDQLSIMLLTIPVFFPLATLMGFDPIWFGVVVLLALEMSLTTPPFGLLLFLMQSVAPKGTTLGQVIRAALPYLACDALLLGVLILFPAITLR
ncbi:MAG: TRAP transporter large permease [Gammaproteobacteria bacterium]|nr:TRAP transporter large permease [Gammaproteobacteria bacterium]MXW19596.1 TRAP transporter large permease [Gammaproteobacteria bacterium]MYH33146.1 TRAP transporter large permease [Gammaproteobacteria bacterium]MYL02380.1 TRAP transporter large permease [Gammaproteobacteria bacterium]